MRRAASAAAGLGDMRDLGHSPAGVGPSLPDAEPAAEAVTSAPAAEAGSTSPKADNFWRAHEQPLRMSTSWEERARPLLPVSHFTHKTIQDAGGG